MSIGILNLLGSSGIGNTELDRKDWLLIFLYAPDQQGNTQPIAGSFTLSLLSFVVSEQLNELTDRELPFEFESSKKGPRDKKIPENLEDLTNNEMILRGDPPDDDFDIDDHTYSILPEGRTRAEKIYQQLNSVEKNEVERLKNEYAVEDPGDLVVYTHRQSGEMFEGELIRR